MIIEGYIGLAIKVLPEYEIIPLETYAKELEEFKSSKDFEELKPVALEYGVNFDTMEFRKADAGEFLEDFTEWSALHALVDIMRKDDELSAFIENVLVVVGIEMYRLLELYPDHTLSAVKQIVADKVNKYLYTSFQAEQVEYIEDEYAKDETNKGAKNGG